MKYLLAFICLASCFNPCQAQNYSEWFRQKKTQKSYLLQQIVGLQYYINLAEHWYQMVQKGTQTWHELQSGNIKIHQLFFQSLKTPNPIVLTGQSATAKAWRELQDSYSKGKRFLIQQDFVSEKEQSQLLSLWEKIYQKGKSLTLDQQQVLTANHWTLQAAERTERLQHIQKAMILLANQAHDFEQVLHFIKHQHEHRLQAHEHFETLFNQPQRP